MVELLKVENLCKKYEKFEVKDISFSVKPGRIVGFIGKNGGGKSTVLKSIMNYIPKDSGRITMFGLNFDNHEVECKQRIGFATGEVNYYRKKKLKQLVDITKRFYSNFDEAVFQNYVARFNLDLDKNFCELSKGMEVKYTIALALSHGAELLILDEPTSGLDPIARIEIIKILENFVSDGKKSVLFSEHITPDLEKCADDIVYIRNGKLEYSGTKNDFMNQYRYVHGEKELFRNSDLSKFCWYEEHKGQIEGLLPNKETILQIFGNVKCDEPTIEQIMVGIEKRGAENEKHAL